MIEIKNVSKEFVKNDEKNQRMKFFADNDISFKVRDGEVVGLLGPNGAGKTTLLRMLAGVMKPTSGQITFDGKEINEEALDIKKNIAFLSGNTKLYKDFSCVEFFRMCGSYYGMNKNFLEKRIEETVDRFDLGLFKNQRIGNLSTGQTQRVGIARCVLHDPQYYIFDEATSGLDIISSQIILNFIKEERDKGKCIIYSTHYMEEAENICDRVVLVNRGHLIAEGTAEEIERNTNTNNIRDAFFAMIGGKQ